MHDISWMKKAAMPVHPSDFREDFMEIETTARLGNRVLFRVERDTRSVFQIFAYFTLPGGIEEQRLPCSSWKVRKTVHGFEEGVSASGILLEVPRMDWDRIVAMREDLRDRDNLPNICLVKVHSRGDVLTVDGYTLSARVDRTTWEKISHCMIEVDTSLNDEVYEGDHFTGWIIREGMEAEVERILAESREKMLGRCQ